MIISEDVWPNLDLRLAGGDGDAVSAAKEELRRDERPDVDSHLDAVTLRLRRHFRAPHRIPHRALAVAAPPVDGGGSADGWGLIVAS